MARIGICAVEACARLALDREMELMRHQTGEQLDQTIRNVKALCDLIASQTTAIYFPYDGDESHGSLMHKREIARIIEKQIDEDLHRKQAN